jgi:3alpha(or 20beta)-hydroxysteroid dehydrogenase
MTEIKKVALVTGAARGIGLGVAKKFLSQGWRVALLDIEGELLRAAHAALDAADDTLALQCDVADAPAVAGAVAEIERRFGRLDALVNNAGILQRASIEAETAEEFERLWRVNCLGAFLGMKAAVPHLRAHGKGAIVNTLSTAALTAWTDHGAYVSSKWALRGLTKVAALELARDNIRVNAIVPGPVLTPMVLRDDDPTAAVRLAGTPLGRAGLPSDIAELVLFLVSDRSAFMTGAELVIDGGQTAGTIMRAAP